MKNARYNVCYDNPRYNDLHYNDALITTLVMTISVNEPIILSIFAVSLE